jgi:hypothetical protein
VDAVAAAMHAWSGGACNSQLASICFEADLEQLKHFSLQDLWDVDASYVLKILRSARNLSGTNNWVTFRKKNQQPGVRATLNTELLNAKSKSARNLASQRHVNLLQN